MRLLLKEVETAGASPLATCDAPRGAAKVVIRDTDGISGPRRGRTGAGRDRDVLSCPTSCVAGETLGTVMLCGRSQCIIVM